MTAPLTSPRPSAVIGTQGQAPAPAASTAETSGTSTNLIDKIDFGALYSSLSQQGIYLNDKEKERLERITREELDRQNYTGGSDIIQLLFAFLASLFSGNGATNFDDIGKHLSASNDKAMGMVSLRQIQIASGNIYSRMIDEGGNLSTAAELVTGASRSGNAPADMNASIYRQLHPLTGLPWGTSSTIASLNPANQTEAPSVQTNLPRHAATQALTPHS